MLARLSALVLALLVAGSGLSPCAAAALAHGAGPAHAEGHAAGHEAGPHGGSADCHEHGATLSPRCDCGCTGDLPRAAASSFASPWALPAPSLPRLEPAETPAPRGHGEQLRCPVPSRIEHVPLSA
jgi:hypothetical protein